MRAAAQPVVHADLSAITGTIDDMVTDKTGRAYVGDLGFDLKSGIKSGPYGRIILVERAATSVVADGLNFPTASRYPRSGGSWSSPKPMATAWRASISAPTASLDFDRRFGQFRAPDGICLDRDQAVWVSLLDEHSFVRVAPDGRILDRIAVPGRRGVACVLGGEDRRTLVLCQHGDATADAEAGPKPQSYVDTVVVEVPGAGYP